MSSREAVIVSYARTAIGKAFRGAFNITHPQTMAAHVIHHATARAGVDPDEIEDVVFGCGITEGTTGFNVARASAIRAGIPNSAGGLVVSRHCASGLQAIATAAQQVVVDKVPLNIAGGIEHVTQVIKDRRPGYQDEPWMSENRQDLFMPMIDTADIVAKRYQVSREQQDEYALQSQQRTADAQQSGKFVEEIVPLTTERRSRTGKQEKLLLRKSHWSWMKEIDLGPSWKTYPSLNLLWGQIVS